MGLGCLLDGHVLGLTMGVAVFKMFSRCSEARWLKTLAQSSTNHPKACKGGEVFFYSHLELFCLQLSFFACSPFKALVRRTFPLQVKSSNRK